MTSLAKVQWIKSRGLKICSDFDAADFGIESTIVEETDEFWVFNKPAGISVNDSESSTGYISLLKEALGVERIHPVHRLDKGTSGLLLAAKTPNANKLLSRAFLEGNVRKIYVAVVHSKIGQKPKKKQGWITGDMKPIRNGSWMLLRSKNNPAVTYFKMASLGERYRLVVLSLSTGKTHQIRVAMKSNSTPIIGDRRYGGEEADRMHLHAFELGFEMKGREFHYRLAPTSGEYFSEIRLRKLEELMSQFRQSLD